MIGIVDTGCANIASLRFALERLGAQPIVSAELDVLKACERLFLPGVGTARFAMNSLEARGLTDFLQGWRKPVLGICLGMQLLCQRSFEKEVESTCLGICDGEVQRLDAGELPMPHMGWNTLKSIEEHALFAGIPEGSSFYFVHSYGLAPSAQSLATCEYGQPFAAAIGKGNALGVQFHPERSGPAGAKLLSNFLAWKGNQ